MKMMKRIGGLAALGMILPCGLLVAADRDGEKKKSAEAGAGARKDGQGDKGKRSAEGDRGGKADPAKRELSAKVRKLERIYQAYDKDENGSVSFEEWLSMKEGKVTPDRRKREKGWFDLVDADKNGKVSLEEWKDSKLKQEKRREGGDRPAEGDAPRKDKPEAEPGKKGDPKEGRRKSAEGDR